MDGDQYLPFLKHVLTSKRLEHSLHVRLVMGELAKVYGLVQKQALVAGLLHDAAKDLDESEWKKLVAEVLMPRFPVFCTSASPTAASLIQSDRPPADA